MWYRLNKTLGVSLVGRNKHRVYTSLYSSPHLDSTFRLLDTQPYWHPVTNDIPVPPSHHPKTTLSFNRMFPPVLQQKLRFIYLLFLEFFVPTQPPIPLLELVGVRTVLEKCSINLFLIRIIKLWSLVEEWKGIRLIWQTWNSQLNRKTTVFICSMIFCTIDRYVVRVDNESRRDVDGWVDG